MKNSELFVEGKAEGYTLGYKTALNDIIFISQITIVIVSYVGVISWLLYQGFK